MVHTSTILIIIATTGLFAWIVANMGIGEILVKWFLHSLRPLPK
jgi:TRAP-type C4-dicarboxylate transport system permease large subunit